MPKMDYFALINQAKAEKAALVDQADQMIADKKFGTDLEAIQNKIKDKAAEIDQLTNQAAISAAGAEPVKNPDGVQDGKDGGKDKPLKVFNSLGEQLQAIRNAAKGEVDERLIRVNNAIMGTNTETGADGGYAIQEDFAGNILESAAQTGEILSRVDTYTCSANSNSVRWMTAKEEDISDSVFGGVKMFWAEEGETVEATKPQFREARLELEKMMGFAYATEELLQDAAFMSSLFGRAFTIGARRLLEGAIISGDGEKKPLGMLNSTATIEVAKASDQGAGTITADNIFGMWQRTLHEYRSRLVWLAHPDAELQLQKLTFNGESIWMPEGGLRDTPFQKVLGRPVIYTDHMSALGTKGDIMLCDPMKYLLVKKGSVKQDWSMHVEFLTAQHCFRVIYRCNGKPKVDAPLKIKNSTLTRSPFVTLAARQ